MICLFLSLIHVCGLCTLEQALDAASVIYLCYFKSYPVSLCGLQGMQSVETSVISLCCSKSYPVSVWFSGEQTEDETSVISLCCFKSYPVSLCGLQESRQRMRPL